MTEKKQVKNYLEMKVKTATPLQLIIMLYDKAISSLNNAIGLLENNSKKFDVINNNILKAQEIVSELMLSLDFEKGKEIAENLYKIYDYIIRECIDANIKKDKEKLKNIVKILSELKSAWEAISNDASLNKIKGKTNNMTGSSFNVQL